MSTGRSRIDPRADFALMAILALVFVGVAIAAAVMAVKTGAIRFDLREHPETERFTARAADPAHFLAGFSSYQSVASAKAVIEASSATWTQTERHALPSSRYPVRDFDELFVTDFGFCGSNGLLSLQFFNDRLFEATFDPVDAQVCLQAIGERYPALQRDDNGRAEWVDGQMRIATNLELAISPVGRALDTRPYVIWQDQRLIAERDEWERRFAASGVAIQ